MAAIVLVGGKESTPFMPAGNEPFLHWLLQWLKSQGFTQIIFSAAHHSKEITTWVNEASHRETKLCLDVVIESTPLGTGGAVALSANRYPNDITLVTNGDSLLLENLHDAMYQLKEDESLDGIIFATTLPNAGRFGSLEFNKNKKLISFKEKHSGNGPINAGIYLLRNELFANIPTDKKTSLESKWFPLWLKEGKNFQVFVSQAPFLELDAKDAADQANNFIEKYREKILGHVETIQSESIL